MVHHRLWAVVLHQQIHCMISEADGTHVVSSDVMTHVILAFSMTQWRN